MDLASTVPVKTASRSALFGCQLVIDLGLDMVDSRRYCCAYPGHILGNQHLDKLQFCLPSGLQEPLAMCPGGLGGKAHVVTMSPRQWPW